MKSFKPKVHLTYTVFRFTENTLSLHHKTSLLYMEE
jgi:hypothetical protein